MKLIEREIDSSRSHLKSISARYTLPERAACGSDRWYGYGFFDNVIPHILWGAGDLLDYKKGDCEQNHCE